MSPRQLDAVASGYHRIRGLTVFNGYLTNQEISELTIAALGGGLLHAPREVLLAGIPPAFVGTLPASLPPLDQFTLDLLRVNEVERMAGGNVPIVILLRNAADRLRLLDRAEAQVFARVLSRVTNVATGLPPLPDPARLPEVVGKQRITGTNDIVDIGFLTAGLDVAEAVTLISVPRFEKSHQVMTSEGLPWISSGTAWLIAPGLAITNHHVINARLSGEAEADEADLEQAGRRREPPLTSTARRPTASGPSHATRRPVLGTRLRAARSGRARRSAHSPHCSVRRGL